MFEAHFQTFEDLEAGVALTARLAAFREELVRRKLTGFAIPRADQQQNEYVAPSAASLTATIGTTLTGLKGLKYVCASHLHHQVETWASLVRVAQVVRGFRPPSW